MKIRYALGGATAAIAGATFLLVASAGAQQTPAPGTEPPAAAHDMSKMPGMQMPAADGQQQRGPRQGARGDNAGRQGMAGMGMGGMDARMTGRMARMSPDDMSAYLDAHLAAVKAGLKLTADQDKLWGPVESAVREGMTRAMDMRKAAAAATAPASPLDGMKRMADAMSTRAEVMHKFVDAAQPLFASLSDDQKRRLPVLMRAMHNGEQGGMRQRMGAMADGMRSRMQGWWNNNDRRDDNRGSRGDRQQRGGNRGRDTDS